MRLPLNRSPTPTLNKPYVSQPVMLSPSRLSDILRPFRTMARPAVGTTLNDAGSPVGMPTCAPPLKVYSDMLTSISPGTSTPGPTFQPKRPIGQTASERRASSWRPNVAANVVWLALGPVIPPSRRFNPIPTEPKNLLLPNPYATSAPLVASAIVPPTERRCALTPSSVLPEHV